MCSAKDGFKEAEENFTKMVEKYKSPSALWQGHLMNFNN